MTPLPFRSVSLRPEHAHPPDRESAEPVCGELVQIPGEEPFRAYTVSALRRLQQRPWVIDGVLRQGHLMMLYGGWSAGKTFVAIDMALSVAMGIPWTGRATRRSRVLFLSAEDREDVRTRVFAWAQVHGVSDAELDQWFRLEVKAVQIKYETERRRLVDHYAKEGFRPEFVVLDNFGVLADDVNESASGQHVAPWCQGAKRLGREWRASVVFLHHMTKDGKTYLGSIAFGNHIEASLEVERQDGTEEISIEADKHKHTPSSMKLRARFLLVPVPMPAELSDMASAVLQPVEKGTAGLLSAPDRATRHPHDALLLGILHDRGALDTGAWMGAAEQAGVKRTAFYDARKRLEVQNLTTSTAGKGNQKINSLTDAGRARVTPKA